MRRKYLGLAIAAITALGPTSAFGGDREIAQEIMTRLKSNRDAGALKDFTLDMKVDQGIVLFRGTVSETAQKQLVLSAANGVDGVAKVLDEVKVKTAAVASEPVTTSIEAPTNGPSLRDMLSQAKATAAEKGVSNATLEIAPGTVQPTAAVELAQPIHADDQQVVAGVVEALGSAQQAGVLKGFGVDVQCNDGIVSLKGLAGSPQQRDEIVRITQSVPGVQGVDHTITVAGHPQAAPMPMQSHVPAQLASNRMTPVSVDQVPAMATPRNRNLGVPVAQVAAPMANNGTVAAPTMGAPVSGTPVPMAYGASAGAPRYDTPNLPNYAWPGYASYPNYAALTYPQQYSPTAWPYIGPFYPYPQVPLGWRKVSLEWDDGWWFLDFTDR
ncbi:BON domain-containing protein [Roseiconus nitratireducens]|uniref:BON domain-containing protein n=1 Tax=Roseiconus nitratireducens TaxID=2605748 RepID=A0A5M6DFL6_9BACT|nr:BON domain-containing protein [Roseiconus nitratireducens]KAA5546193.1 BON domain-containing protein [Roseiconus nitratireducens]